jgi:hypothetical protein
MGLRLEVDQPLDPKAMQNATKSAFRKIRITSDIDLLVSGKKLPKSIKTEFSKNEQQITITIDIGGAQ